MPVVAVNGLNVCGYQDERLGHGGICPYEIFDRCRRKAV
jgi:hypothetical protein